MMSMRPDLDPKGPKFAIRPGSTGPRGGSASAGKAIRQNGSRGISYRAPLTFEFTTATAPEEEPDDCRCRHTGRDGRGGLAPTLAALALARRRWTRRRDT
jgi:hypothetical protein